MLLTNECHMGLDWNDKSKCQNFYFSENHSLKNRSDVPSQQEGNSLKVNNEKLHQMTRVEMEDVNDLNTKHLPWRKQPIISQS